MIIKLPYLIIALLIFVGKITRFFFFQAMDLQVSKLNIIEKVKARFDERFQMILLISAIQISASDAIFPLTGFP